jgi:hypothetical protein
MWLRTGLGGVLGGVDGASRLHRWSGIYEALAVPVWAFAGYVVNLGSSL